MHASTLADRLRRLSLLAIVLGLSTTVLACASGSDTGPGIGADAAPEGGGSDGGIGEGGLSDARGADASDGGDAGPPADAGPDAVVIPSGQCGTCLLDTDCVVEHVCAELSSGDRACVRTCSPDLPECPRGFSCVLDFSTGIDTTVCLPVGSRCCVDEDVDGYGEGVGCDGLDCDDTSPDVNPGLGEICDGIDNNCNDAIDEPMTDCSTGRCSMLPGGTYQAIESASCDMAECISGTITDCGLFACAEGLEAGTACATSCELGGVDQDSYCADTAHCDLGVCEADAPDGGACDEDTDCQAGHCENGFCCSAGACCSVAADCPGSGGVGTVCDDPSGCQGSRGELTCIDSRCDTLAGIPDDSACAPTTLADECGLFVPIYCSGEPDQPTPSCPSTCAADDECDASAHCEAGSCVADRPQGSPCARGGDCISPLFCVDGVCCDGACGGECESCSVAGSEGSCAPVPVGQDPAGECAGFSCDAYFFGFDAAGQCLRRAAISDVEASCGGARACLAAAELCPTSSPGVAQIVCDSACQAPFVGTCEGVIPGVCRDLDDPADRLSCGDGACAVTQQRCIGGLLQTCVPGLASEELCNAIDDDCNRLVD
ncbi:MAG: putative metal-binding motif-containing protein, partial [Myxococcales bacterium]|nr:putative metal-binding motif-containing protein [Myxococcales bacterium]